MNTRGWLTKLDGGGLLTLLAVLAQQLLPPCLHDKHVVDGNNVDLLDTLGLELVVFLDVTRDLVRARWGEAKRMVSHVEMITRSRYGP